MFYLPLRPCQPTQVSTSKMMRQGANSAVRFTTYATLKQFVQGTIRPGQPLPSAITFGIGGIAGLVTVYTTMPLEYVPPFFFSLCVRAYNQPTPSHLTVSSKPACNRWALESSIGIRSIAFIEFSLKKACCVFGPAQLLDLRAWWCVVHLCHPVLFFLLRLILFFAAKWWDCVYRV